MKLTRSQTRPRDVVLLAGWLFSDLLLGLMIIFLAAIPPIPKTIHLPVPPPILVVTPAHLDTTQCQGGKSNPQCTLTLSVTAASKDSADWTASSDMSDFNTKVNFSRTSGTLAPGQSVHITISGFPCQNGSFTFQAKGPKSGDALPVTALWHCVPDQQRLNFNPVTLIFTVDDNGLVSDSQNAINNFKQAVEGRAELVRKSVALAIVYGGAPTDSGIGHAQQLSTKVCSILVALGKEFAPFQRASCYNEPLHTLNVASSYVRVDVYFFQQ